MALCVASVEGACEGDMGQQNPIGEKEKHMEGHMAEKRFLEFSFETEQVMKACDNVETVKQHQTYTMFTTFPAWPWP